MGSHAVAADLFLPFDVPFNSASFRDELALLLDVPVDRVRITGNSQFVGDRRRVIVAIIDLTRAHETEVSAFFDDNRTFTLDGFGTVTVSVGADEVAKSNATIRIFDVCTSVSATGFPQAAYIQAFNNALAPTASVTTSIFLIAGNSPSCADATAAGSTQVITDIQVPAADFGAVLALLPTASSTIDLRGVFGEVSLGDTAFFV